MLNADSLKLITEFEGFVPNWYPDPAHGWKVPTCCYGHTDAAGAPKYADDKARIFTKTEGMEILRRDLVQYEDAVKRVVKVQLNENQIGALTSFTFNLGAGNLEKSTLVKKINAGDMAGASKEFSRWNKAAGKVLPGLTRRRAAEAALFMKQPANKPVILEPAPHLGPPDAPIIVHDEDPIVVGSKPSLIPWIIGAVLLVAAVIFILTQVKF